MLEVMIGVALAVIAIAVFLSMRSGSNSASKANESGQDVGLLTNKVLGISSHNFEANSYYFVASDASQNSLQTYINASDAFMANLGDEGVNGITVSIEISEDENAVQV